MDHQRKCQVMLPLPLTSDSTSSILREKSELSMVSCWPWPLTLPFSALTLFLALESHCLYPILEIGYVTANTFLCGCSFWTYLCVCDVAFSEPSEAFLQPWSCFLWYWGSHSGHTQASMPSELRCHPQLPCTYYHPTLLSVS